MTSDIAVKDLNRIDAEDAAYLVSKIGTVPGFPKPGILFRDFIPVFADAKALSILMDALVAALPVPADQFDAIAALEARGFLFGPSMAVRLGKSCVAVRKAGKLPTATYSQEYTLEYGVEKVEIERDSVKPGERVLIVDDLIATGGSAKAAKSLIEQAGGTVVGFEFVMGLDGLDGLSKLGEVPSTTLVTMPA